MSSLPLTVVVCTYNRATLLRRCLASLAAQTAAADRFEVLVVDNASTDHTGEVIADFVEQFAHFRSAYEATQGLSHARNRGWREARGRFVAYLDDDAEADVTWCETILETLDRVPDAAAIGGPIMPHFEKPPPDWFSPRLEVRDWGDEAKFLEPPLARFGFSGSNMVIRRSLLEALGGFAPHLGMRGEQVGLGEETEFFMRLYASHPSFWYEPALRVYHLTPARKFEPRYRVERAFEAGKAHALIGAERQAPGRFFVRKFATAAYHCGRKTFSRLEQGDSPRLVALIVAEEVAHRAGLLSQALRQTIIGAAAAPGSPESTGRR